MREETLAEASRPSRLSHPRHSNSRVIESARKRVRLPDMNRHPCDLEARKQGFDDAGPERFDQVMLLAPYDLFRDFEYRTIIDCIFDPVTFSRNRQRIPDLKINSDRSSESPLFGRDTQSRRNLDPFDEDGIIPGRSIYFIRHDAKLALAKRSAKGLDQTAPKRGRIDDFTQ